MASHNGATGLDQEVNIAQQQGVHQDPGIGHHPEMDMVATQPSRQNSKTINSLTHRRN